jgi:hypothetical protein
MAAVFEPDDISMMEKGDFYPISKMTQQTLFREIRDRFTAIVEARSLSAEMVKITSKALSAQEAIGTTKRQDYPIITGKEIMLQADYKGSLGQAFTDAPPSFRDARGYPRPRHR